MRATKAVQFATLLLFSLVGHMIQSQPLNGGDYWRAIRDRWEFFHGLRTVVSLAALACLFASTLSTASHGAARLTHGRPIISST